MKTQSPLEKLQDLEEKRRALHKEIMTLMNDYAYLAALGEKALNTPTANMQFLAREMREGPDIEGAVPEELPKKRGRKRGAAEKEEEMTKTRETEKAKEEAAKKEKARREAEKAAREAQTQEREREQEQEQENDGPEMDFL